MAGDWIKMRVDLNDDPAVIAIAASTGLDEYEVVGRLHKFWSWADRHSVDGNALSVTRAWIDRYLQCDKFAEALFHAGWLEGEDGVIDLPHFDRHNGESAKKRAQTNKRVAEHRERQRGGNADSVTEGATESVTKSVTREEKRREEETTSLSGEPDAATEIIEYLNGKTGRKFGSVKANLDLVKARLKEGATVETIKAVIDAKVKAWKGDPKMDEYLRPETLFGARKFAQYSGQLGASGKANEEWWTAAGFAKEWQATNAGCTAVSAHLWRDGQKAEV